MTTLSESILAAWRTTARMNELLVAELPEAVWSSKPIPGMRRSVRSIGGHLHNARCRWVKTLGVEHGIAAPAFVDLHRVTRRQLIAALKKSTRSMEALLSLGLDAGGVLPPSRSYVWRNLPLDVGHVLAYFVAHEAHHRGQLLLLARLMGTPVSREISDGLWWWMPRKAPRPGKTSRA
ncbi:MAG: DinB family protein [Gemmatimonadaceae bacterium]